jgi:ASC-1-like (ASCH) protein
LTTNKTFAEKTSADDKSIGFDFQYYYFLYTLLNLRVGQSAGLEVKDDVHTALDHERNILYQVKHTVQNTATGDAEALTELDPDLWKTLSNWSQMVIDPNAGRADVAKQLDFIRRTEFHLISNKSSSSTNRFLAAILKFHREEIDYIELSNEISRLATKAKGVSTKLYIANVRSLNEAVAKRFFGRIHFELGQGDIFSAIKQAILEKAIDAKRVDATFERLDSNIRQDNFIAVKAGQPLVISFDQFMARYRKIFEDSRGTQLRYVSFKPELPPDIFSQAFIKQLLLVADISPSDDELAIEYTTYRVRTVHHLRRWVQTGELVTDDVDALHEEVKLRWRQEFRSVYQSCKPEDILSAAQSMLRLMRRERFQLGQTELNTQMSNGELYHLSENSEIGWHKDWKK